MEIMGLVAALALVTLPALVGFDLPLQVSSPGAGTQKKQTRVDPRSEGVNLTFSPVRFTYKHEYSFKDLPTEAKSVYFLLPRSFQEHTITSANYYLNGDRSSPLKYEVVSETPGWRVARAEIPPSKNFTVLMDVSGIHWNGKLAKAGNSSVPSDIAPPEISDEMMNWYSKRSPFLSRVEPTFSNLLRTNGLDNLGDDFFGAFLKSYKFLAQSAKYDASGANIDEFLQGKINCNGSNRTLVAIFNLDSSGQYAGVDLTGIVMNDGNIHAMSLVGKKGWSRLVPTDAVKFNDGNMDPYYLSGTSMGPMLIFQEGFGDPAIDAKGGVTFRVKETNRVVRGPNPGAMMFAFDGAGNFAGELKKSFISGKKVSFQSQPITDFVALRRELGLVADSGVGGSSNSGGLGTEERNASQGEGLNSVNFGGFSLPDLESIGVFRN
jgi:hypothetical protein